MRTCYLQLVIYSAFLQQIVSLAHDNMCMDSFEVNSADGCLSQDTVTAS